MKKIYLLFLSLSILFPLSIDAQCATPTTVPYYEDFQAITANNQLPACWGISSQNACITFTASGSGGNAAAFVNQPAGSNYFYTSGIQLKAGITYSVSSWYRVIANNMVTWTDFSMLIGTSQSTLALTTIAATTGNILNTTYAALSNTFTVPTNGVYYLAIKASSNGSGGSQTLNWDELEVTIPCTPLLNAPSITVSSSSTVLCSGSVFTASASGADAYVWNNAVTGSTFSFAPANSIQLNLVGTSTLTGCTNSTALSLSVNPSPAIFILVNNPSICMGSTTNMNVTGASTYTWSDGQQGSMISVSPTLSSTYSVVGTNSLGCESSDITTIHVNVLPVLTVSSPGSSGLICAGETVVLAGGGAQNYQWNSTATTLLGDTVSFIASATTSFNVIGTDVNNCSSSLNYVVQVNSCTGLNEWSEANKETTLYPNPGTGLFFIRNQSGELKHISVTDFTGKVIYEVDAPESSVPIDMRLYEDGVYFVKLYSGTETSYLKYIKQ
jgi:hypothetical protein